MTVGTFTANADDATQTASVPSGEWTAGNYYYLKTGDYYLSLDGNKADSVVVKTIAADATKAAIDSALWQIADKEEALGVTTYMLTNKVTQQVLSFDASAEELVPNLATGVDKWVMTGDQNSGYNLVGYYSGKDFITLDATGNRLSIAKTGGTPFAVEAPPADFLLNAQQLGNGFSVFQLVFGDTYEGNIFAGKELVAKDLTNDAGFVSLQVQGDETFADGKAKLFGVDTTKTVISGATGAYGANFVLDSTYTELAGVHSVGNADYQKFRFRVNLKNDSLAMFVKRAPNVNADVLTSLSDTVRVVYAQTSATKVLTVSQVNADGVPAQGALPLITSKQGTPATIATGTGVYFLKSASKGADGGKYYVTSTTFMDETPSVNLAKGQWYIKENNGRYSVVDRTSNSVLGSLNMEIFAIQGMANTYLFGVDSVTVEYQKDVNLNNKYLGSLYFTEEQLNDNGYVLNLISGTSGVSDLYAYTTDSILKGKSGDGKDAAVFKLIPNDTTVVAGAQKLGDYLSVITYKLRGLFDQDTIAATDNNGLKFSTYTKALAFKFIPNSTAEKYSMITGDQYVAMNVNTSNLELTTDAAKSAYVNLEAVDAPEYATFANGHKRLSYNNNALVMNPYTFFAEMKAEGNEMKANYDADNFSLWVEQDMVIAGKQLYFISSGMVNAGKEEAAIRYYLAAKDTTRTGVDATTFAMFINNDTIKTMENSPALFAFKTAEDGGYYLENQSQLKSGKPYVGVVNGFAVMQEAPSAAFVVENASAPTPNEEINVSEIKVISSDGQIIVTNASGKKITLSNILGQTIGVRRASSEYFSMPATSGIVLVTVEGDTTYKVIVK
ncbi:DUF6383 domain-containing protein [uncultured Parabacteroides sp.]